jgi:hypothetical protein
MRCFALIIVFGFCAGIAAASDWQLRPGDQKYGAAELARRLDGQTLEFHDGGRSRYGPGNAYVYIYADEESVPGVYAITDKGEVCVTFLRGARRCDLYVRNGGREILIDENGDRYPLR